MNEQRTGVDDFDPDVALYLIIQQSSEVCDELWNARFQEAAFGEYSALNGEAPADVSEYEEAALEQAKDFVCDQLDSFTNNGLMPLVFNPDTQAWCPIRGVGINRDLLGLVAVIVDPKDPNSSVTKFLGRETNLIYTEPTTMFEPMDGLELRLDLYTDPFSRTSDFLPPLPFKLTSPLE